MTADPPRVNTPGEPCTPRPRERDRVRIGNDLPGSWEP
jgi:hypothetical protein